MSKGSNPRPLSVTPDEYAARFDAIFGNKERDAKEGDLSSGPALINAGDSNGIPERAVG